MTGTVTPPAPTLDAFDRCDRCNAQAFVRVLLANGDLTFCGHHGKFFEPSLRAQALEWIDETAQLG